MTDKLDKCEVADRNLVVVDLRAVIERLKVLPVAQNLDYESCLLSCRLTLANLVQNLMTESEGAEALFKSAWKAILAFRTGLSAAASLEEEHRKLCKDLREVMRKNGVLVRDGVLEDKECEYSRQLDQALLSLEHHVWGRSESRIHAAVQKLSRELTNVTTQFLGV